jgi:hypothetical protein
MKQKGNSSLTKPNNSKLKASNDNENEQISTSEFTKAMTRLMNELKKVT